jgi:hypothetical protein
MTEPAPRSTEGARVPGDEAERVPIFGTWPRIYAAVVVCAVVVMALVWVFSVWPF